MADKMVERVARAILADIKSCDSYVMPHADTGLMTVDGHFDIADLARAAITALREPTEAMIRAGRIEIDGDDLGGSDAVARDAWRAMIDAALK
jgi:hypothetical protein